MSDETQVLFEPTIACPTEADWAEMESLLQSCGLPTEGLKQHLKSALVARLGGLVVGMAAVEMHPGDVGVLRSVAVVPPVKDRGLGTQLVHCALRIAQSYSLQEIVLLTDTAESFFARFGFEPVERWHVASILQTSSEFSLDRCRKATVMRLSLPESALFPSEA